MLLYAKFTMFSLVSDRVHDFSLPNHHFVRVVADSSSAGNQVVSTGFYEQLYGGKVEVLAKRTKNLQSGVDASASVIVGYFLSNNQYYLRKGNTYYSISSQSSFLNVLKDKKSQLQQYIRDNNIKFKQDREAAMVKIASYYDQLITKSL